MFGFQQSKPRLRGFFHGFTLIEIIIVIIVIGILSAVIASKYFDVSSEAHNQNVRSLAGALNAASARNFTRNKLGKSSVSITNCTEVANALTQSMPSGFTITPTALSAGAEVSCTVTHTASSQSATFIGIGVS